MEFLFDILYCLSTLSLFMVLLYGCWNQDEFEVAVRITIVICIQALIDLSDIFIPIIQLIYLLEFSVAGGYHLIFVRIRNNFRHHPRFIRHRLNKIGS